MNDKLAQYQAVMDKKAQALYHKQQMERMKSLENTVVSSMRQLVQFLNGKTTKTEVINQLKEVGTPDVEKVVKALEKLETSVISNKLDISPLEKGLTALEQQLKKLPTEFPEYEAVDEVTVKNQIDLKPLEKAIKSLELKAPDVNVVSPAVNVDAPDLSPIKDSLLDVVKAIKAIPETPATDLSKVEKKLDEANKHLKKLVDKPVAGGGGGGNGTPYTDSTGKLVNVELESDGSVPVTVTSTSSPSKLLIDEASATITYIGKASIGTSTASTAWQIQKINQSTNPTSITYAASGASTAIWDNRASEVYS